MATSAGEVEVKLTLNADDFKRMMGQSQNQLQQFGGALDQLGTRLLAVFSFAAIADFFKNSLQAYADSQLSIAKLVATLGAHGIASEALVEHLNQQSLALEALTGIQQVAITNSQAMLVTYGLQGPILDKATEAATNFAVRTGSIETATNLLAKAYEGNTTMLKRYGITIDQTLPQAEQFEALLKKINTQFGPVAQAQAGTFTGQMNALSNGFTHLKEEIGKLLAGPGGDFASWLKALIANMTDAVRFLNSVSDATRSFDAVLKAGILVTAQAVFGHMLNLFGLLLSILSQIPVVGNQFAALRGQVDLMKLAVDSLNTANRKNFIENTAGNNALIKQEKDKLTAFKNTAQEKMDVDKTMNAWIRNENSKTKNEFMAELKEEDQGFSKFADTFITTQADMWNFASQMSSTFFASMGDAWAKQIVEGQSFTESIKAAFKNMAEQIISFIAQIIAKLLAMWAIEMMTGINLSGGGTGTSFLSGFMAGGGMINEPSIITGLKSGTHILAGEAGPEAVVPTGSSNQTADQMGGGNSSGGNVTINISGQFLEADSATWNRLMREQIIPQIRRFTMISATGPFNRTRGVM